MGQDIIQPQANTNWENDSKAGKWSPSLRVSPFGRSGGGWASLTGAEGGGCWARSRQKHSLESHSDSPPGLGPVSGRSIVLGSKGGPVPMPPLGPSLTMLSALTLPLCQISTWTSASLQCHWESRWRQLCTHGSFIVQAYRLNTMGMAPRLTAYTFHSDRASCNGCAFVVEVVEEHCVRMHRGPDTEPTGERAGPGPPYPFANLVLCACGRKVASEISEWHSVGDLSSPVSSLTKDCCCSLLHMPSPSCSAFHYKFSFKAFLLLHLTHMVGSSCARARIRKLRPSEFSSASSPHLALPSSPVLWWPGCKHNVTMTFACPVSSARSLFSLKISLTIFLTAFCHDYTYSL